ncbi:uncharacterized protein LOC135226642 [Macrobrachium nipponense]|uniref:uncharacterized protein LOC135226642 n=1 Tax=Macrobrachium nipponense TaxID=159736 RepID=UPI0030C80127
MAISEGYPPPNQRGLTRRGTSITRVSPRTREARAPIFPPPGVPARAFFGSRAAYAPPSRGRAASFRNFSFGVSLCIGVFLFTLNNGAVALGRGSQGPSFRTEPPRVVHFTNSTGAIVDCLAEGTPTPAITWTNQEGRVVEQVPGLREALVNGSLYFPPFPASQYNQQVHSITYMCRATSPAGTLLALPTQVREEVGNCCPNFFAD